MGNTYFYGKIVSLFGGSNFKKGNAMKSMLKMMMMSQMFSGNANVFGGNSSNDTKSNNGNNFMQVMLMSQMFGGSEGNLFDNLLDGVSFGNILSTDSDDKAENSNNDNEEEE